ncbi:MAG: hypothetical protein J5517_10560 [Eubacterium sp.]|nr:hypothetical protein [Eubacterium sp.]
MDKYSFTDFLKADSEVENMEAPEVKGDHPVYNPIDEEQAAIRRRRESKQKEPEWNGGGVSKDFYKYDYENSKLSIISKTKKMSKRLIVLIIILFIVSSISSISLFVRSLKSMPTNVTKMVKYDEGQFSKALDVTFVENDYFARLVRVFSEEKVTAKTADGFGIIYIGGKQQGVFFDSPRYKLFGLKVGDKCDEDFSKVKYSYDKVYKETVDYSEGFKNYCYLYNTGVGDCMIISYDTRTNQILELGYFYNYKTILYYKI